MALRDNPTHHAVAIGLTLWLACPGDAAALALAEPASGSATGAQTNVVFKEYSALSSNEEVARRLLSPLAVEALRRQLALSGKELTGQPLDLSLERFALYVPPSPSPEGYGVLVFVPPWDDAVLPEGWAAVLDQYGVIYVSPARSGNEAQVLTRRVPLAVLAATNVSHQFRIDPRRVYVGGFSGGSRVALRIALGYPDLFRGALLNAGGDPIGTDRMPLPPRDLLHQFQSTRIVFITGSEDALHLQQAGESIQSMHKWCVTNVTSDTMVGVSHNIPSPSALSRVLRQLQGDAAAPSFDPGKAAACNAAIDEDIDLRLQRAAGDIAKGDRRRSRKLLRQLDSEFGGLAGPRLLDLARSCDCKAFE